MAKKPETMRDTSKAAHKEIIKLVETMLQNGIHPIAIVGALESSKHAVLRAGWSTEKEKKT